MTDIVEMMRAAGRDDRLADGALYLKAADEIERLRKALQKIEYLERPQVRGMPRRVNIHDIARAALGKREAGYD